MSFSRRLTHQLQPGKAWLWLVPVIFLAFFFLLPLSAIFKEVIVAIGEDGLEADLLLRVWRPLRFTIWQAALSTLLTLCLGLPSAYVFARYRFRGKSVLQALITLPFILPTVVVAASFNALLGPRGLLNVLLVDVLGFSSPLLILNTLKAILLAHVFYNTAIVIRVVGSAWSQLDVRVEHAGRVLGASPLRALWEVTLPLLRPSILSAALLVFLFDFTSFGVILLLGGPRFATLEVEIYIQAMHMLNLPMAGLLSGIQMVCTLLMTVVYLRMGEGASVSLMPRLHGEGIRIARTHKEKLFVGLMVLLLFLIMVAPLGALTLRSVTRLDADRTQVGPVNKGLTLAYYQELFVNRQQSLFYVPPVQALRNSFSYALVTVVISLIMGILVSYGLRDRSIISRLLDPLFMLPLGTSAVTLGLGFILVFNRPPFDLRSLPLLVPIAHSLVALPVVVRTLQPAIASIPHNLRQAAAVLGASPFQVWREVDLPILARAVVISAIFAFTISLGEFGATTFLARPEYPTMPIAIFRYLSQPGAMNYGQALAMATMLMLFCGGSILLIEKSGMKLD